MIKQTQPSARAASIIARYKGGQSLEAVGREFGITRERVRLILVRWGVSERHWCGKKVRGERRRQEAANQKAQRRQMAIDFLEAVARLRAQGIGWHDCAAEMGIACRNGGYLLAKCRRKIQRYGLHEYSNRLFSYEGGPRGAYGSNQESRAA